MNGTYSYHTMCLMLRVANSPREDYTRAWSFRAILLTLLDFFRRRSRNKVDLWQVYQVASTRANLLEKKELL